MNATQRHRDEPSEGAETSGDPGPALTLGAPAVVACLLLAIGYGGYRQAVRRLEAPVFAA
jgi:hypothetical protein